MKLNIMPNGVLQIDGARIVHRNFSGEGSMYNRQGDRNFSIVIDSEEIAEALTAQGWNVKVKPARDDSEQPFMFLPVKVKFNGRGPNVYLRSGTSQVEIGEGEVSLLDKILITNVDLDVRPFDWEVNGKKGRTAYLQNIAVTQEVNRFAAPIDDSGIMF